MYAKACRKVWHMNRFDVLIIGAGGSGTAIARELAKTKRKIGVLEKANDICEGTTKANSGIVHAGHDAIPGTLKAKLNVIGNEKMEKLSKELDFPFQRNGSLVLCFQESDKPQLELLKVRGEQNGVKGLQVLTSQEVWALEPNISKNIVGALYAPTGGIVCPFGLNIALAENAADNGVEFYLNHQVESIEVITEEGENYYIIKTSQGEFEAPIVVNAAGVYADEIHNMVSKHKIKITPRRGEYCLMDKQVGGMVKTTVFQLPTSTSKGILVTPTTHGNILVGPTAEDIQEKEGVNTTAQGLQKVMEKGAKSINGLSTRQVITSFAGLRAHVEVPCQDNSDFIIEESEDSIGFFDVAGIESPGLSCVPAIGEYVANLINEKYPAPINEEFNGKRVGIPSMALANEEEKQKLIANNPAYGNVICRCELVTEGEIMDSIHRTLGATTTDGVKRRVRAGMGRCQSGFCMPKIIEILARELNIDESEVRKAGAEWIL